MSLIIYLLAKRSKRPLAIYGMRYSPVALGRSIEIIWKLGILASSLIFNLLDSLEGVQLIGNNFGKTDQILKYTKLLNRCSNFLQEKKLPSPCSLSLIEHRYLDPRSIILNGRLSPFPISISILGGGQELKRLTNKFGGDRASTTWGSIVGWDKAAMFRRSKISLNYRECWR